MELLIEHLFAKKRLNEAFSVFRRNKALVANAHICYKFDEERAKKNGYKYLPSRLREMDAFLPYEVSLDPTRAGVFMKLSDYGIQETDVIWVDAGNFEANRTIFLDEEVLGLDCEFHDSDCTNFNDTRVATLQVAAKTKCAIFDVMGLEKCGGFAEWLQQMLETPAILKIGHSFDGDVRMLNQTFKTQIAPQSLVQVEKLVPGKRTMGLKTMVKEYFQKEFCKFNQVSAWFQRPLRRAQLHYAALDAVVMIPLYERLKALPQSPSPASQGPSAKPKKKKKPRKKKRYVEVKPEEAEPGEEKASGEVLTFNTVFSRQEYIDKEPRFVVDSSLRRLSRLMRNLALDTENEDGYKYSDLVDIGTQEGRVIVTRNKIFKQNSKVRWIHLREDKLEVQMKALIAFLDLRIRNSQLMTRCVKCNNGDLKVTTFEEVKKHLQGNGYDFKHNMQDIKQFWLCEKCTQVYWEGGQFANARKNYQVFVTDFD